MTRYEHGFLTKCAEYGLDDSQSIALLKQAGGLSSLVGKAVGRVGGALASRGATRIGGAVSRAANKLVNSGFRGTASAIGRRVLGQHAGADFQGRGIMGSGLRGFWDNLTGKTGRNFMNNIEGRTFKDLASKGKGLLSNPNNAKNLAAQDAKTLGFLQRNFAGDRGAEYFGRTMTNAAERQAARIARAQNTARIGAGAAALGGAAMLSGEDRQQQPVAGWAM